MRKISIIGTVGVPANYGGFETLVENIITHNHSDDLQYAVYCSERNYSEKYWVYRGAKTIYLPFKANGIQSIIYDVISILHAILKADVLVILGVSGCIILPFVRLFCKKRIIVNIDGLEHRRDKWNKYVRMFLKLSEKISIKYADVIVADNKGIKDYIKQEYDKDSELIAYGGDHVICSVCSKESELILNEYNLKIKNYSFAVCRIEPENNVHIILEAFKNTNKQIVFVGNWNNSDYGKLLYEKYKNISNISLLYSIYDLKTLAVFRLNCLFYIHGHSAGGTNPSLVEAMFFSRPILAYDVVYNRETTSGKANYFSSKETLIDLLDKPASFFNENIECMVEIAHDRYRWEVISKQYEALYDIL